MRAARTNTSQPEDCHVIRSYLISTGRHRWIWRINRSCIMKSHFFILFVFEIYVFFLLLRLHLLLNYLVTRFRPFTSFPSSHPSTSLVSLKTNSPGVADTSPVFNTLLYCQTHTRIRTTTRIYPYHGDLHDCLLLSSPTPSRSQCLPSS